MDELDGRNSDLKNLFESTGVAAIFPDAYLIIRSFTPAVACIYNLIPSDVGRPITDLVSRLDYTGIADDVRQVLCTLQPLERWAVCHNDPTSFLMRILPCRTPDNAVDGTIITFINVTTIAQADQQQREADVHLAYPTDHDPVTSLANRRTLEARIKQCGSMPRPLRAADSAMHAARRQRGGQTVTFEPSLLATGLVHLQLEQDLFRALDRNELEIHYRPLLTTAQRHLCGFEALLRWVHPERGWISSAEFIPARKRRG